MQQQSQQQPNNQHQVYPPPQQVYPPQQQVYPPQQQVYPVGNVQPMGQPAPRVQFVTPSGTHVQTRKKVWEGYNAKTSAILGWLQIAISIISIILFATGIGIQASRGYNTNYTFYSGTGIWCSILFIISGGFALGAAKHKTTCMIVTNMVMSIVSSVFAFALLGTAAAIVGVEASYHSYGSYRYDGQAKAGVALGSILIILAVAEIIICIVSSGYCCAAVCCGRRATIIVPGGVQYQMVTQAVPMGHYPIYQQPNQQQACNIQYTAQAEQVSMGQVGQVPVEPSPTAPPPYEEMSTVKI